MGKIVTSTVPEFPGSFVLPDFLNMPQVRMWEDAAIAARRQAVEFGQKIKETSSDDAQIDVVALGITDAQIDALYLQSLCSIIEKFELKNFPEHPTPETFPSTPRGASQKLITQMINEIGKLYSGEMEIPNA